MLRKTKSIPKR